MPGIAGLASGFVTKKESPVLAVEKYCQIHGDRVVNFVFFLKFIRGRKMMPMT
jgi:hypothetical protein